jgi:hypothetical protein
MYCFIDFDNTIVSQDRPYEDVTTPFEFLPHARETLYSLVAAGHELTLWSARASPVLLVDPNLDPLVRAGVRKVHRETWEKSLELNKARLQHMLDFVDVELPGVFVAISDGREGKPCPCDLMIDDRCGHPVDWLEINRLYGFRLI